MRSFFLKTLVAASFMVFPWATAQAQWSFVSGQLPETDIRCIASNPIADKIIYAASDRHVYQTTDNGSSWQQVFTVWGDEAVIQTIGTNPLRPETVYIASNQGVWRSVDGGKHWSAFYKGIGNASKSVSCIGVDPVSADKIWLGTSEGLIIVDEKSGTYKKAASFPSVPVYSIFFDKAFPKKVIISAADGIHQSDDNGFRWVKLMSFFEKQQDDELLEESADEEAAPVRIGANIIHHPKLGKFFTATNEGLCGASGEERLWSRISGLNAGNLKINYLEESPSTIYAATDRGVYRWNPEKSEFIYVSKGISSEETHMLVYQKSADRLLAATKRGVFSLIHPDSIAGQESEEQQYQFKPVSSEVRRALECFRNEPTVQEIQKAAIEYAEVHPKKIEQWRRSASKKAWLPTISISQKINDNQNIDLDRGGTADPDKFIQGPNEKSTDWSVGASWDLGDIIWNSDQTSIDTRSRLMVELRNDVLNEVTHLYFERRRLQVETMLSTPPDTMTQVEDQLRIDELTANIDGLTGGFLSRRLRNKTKA